MNMWVSAEIVTMTIALLDVQRGIVRVRTLRTMKRTSQKAGFQVVVARKLVWKEPQKSEGRLGARGGRGRRRREKKKSFGGGLAVGCKCD